MLINQSSKENLKKILFIGIPVVLVLALSITLAACMAQNRGTGEVTTTADTTAPAPEQTTADAGQVGKIIEETTLPIPTVTAPQETGNVVSGNNGLLYTGNGNGTCYVSGIGSCTDSFVIVPQKSPSGDDVTAIGNNAFTGCTALEGIELSSKITTIGSYAFYSSGLKSISIHGKLTSIGSFAFGNCPSLMGISVDASNTKYCDVDGVLFTKDKTTIICYPSGKTDAEYTIAKGVTKIETMAFYNIPALKNVTYGGTSAQWSSVVKGASNESLMSAKMKYTTSTGK